MSPLGTAHSLQAKTHEWLEKLGLPPCKEHGQAVPTLQRRELLSERGSVQALREPQSRGVTAPLTVGQCARSLGGRFA